MQEIQYIGEALIYKQLGHFAITLGFVTSLLAVAGYFFATQKRDLPEYNSWRRIGRISFIIHAVCVLTIMATIFFAMINKRFEYQYVWSHVSDELPFRYIFSAFWEGQEGSFLLWMFWHVVLGTILLFRSGKWEAPVLSVVALVQAFILSMILGIYITEDIKIGSNPLLLLRDTMDLPLFNNADYVRQIQGNGLNPLLQNYWMTIHPPGLFLGFASTVVPFAYAVAGLWTRQHKEWLKPALPWALFSAAALGLGILLGGAWAYEALSFGGYWAWDPVENMSLVPWITLVAGIHTHLVAKSTGYSTKSTYGFYLLSFVLVLYSTFLTRSGVLGESSVHAFTEMGLETQLMLFIFAFLGISLGLMISRRKEIYAPKKEEALASREFWMFIGSLVLFFSAIIITASTSLPVYNQIVRAFNPEFKGITITDPVAHYNKYQLWIAVFIALLSGVTQFLRYKEFNWKSRWQKFGKHTGIAAAAAALLTIATSFWLQLGPWQFWALMFAGMFTLAANLDYLFSFLKGNLKTAGSVLSHAGFGIMIVGIIGSGLNKQNISSNPMAQAGLLDEEMIKKNVLLFKNTPMYMSGYRVTYESDTLVGNVRAFTVNYEKLDESGKVIEEFKVHPQAVYDNQVIEVKAYNPSTKRYFDKDIFTHIATLPLKEANFKEAHEQEKNLKYETFELGNGSVTLLDTVQTSIGDQVIQTEMSIVGINHQPVNPDYEAEPGDFAVGVKLAFKKGDTTFYAEPMVYLRGQLWGSFPVQINDLSMKVRLPEEALLELLDAENRMNFHQFTFKTGDSIIFNGKRITFVGINNDPQLALQEGDVAISSILAVEVPGYPHSYKAEPVFLIRGSRFMTPMSEIPELGLSFYLVKINPDTETFDVMIAQSEPGRFPTIPVQVAKKSYRTDYIILEAIVFPGINLFWLGSVLMMSGMVVAMLQRRKERQKAPVPKPAES